MIENQERDSTQQIYVKLIEEIMSECGDMILRIFHSNNLTYSNGMNFENLLEIIQKNNDQESIKIINMVKEIILFEKNFEMNNFSYFFYLI